MSINTIEDLNNIIPEDFKDALRKHEKRGNFAGLIRHILIIHNADLYFKKAWKHHWDGISQSEDNIYSAYNINMEELAKKYGLDDHIN